MAAVEEPVAENGTPQQPMDEAIDSNISYRYWTSKLGDGNEAPAPAPKPKKLSPEEAQKMHKVPSGGASAWNQAGTWEEKNLSKWATERVQELVKGCGTIALQDPQGTASIMECSSCTGDATMIYVRGKKRFVYHLELSLTWEGELADAADKDIGGTLKVPEAAHGELDEMEIEVTYEKSKKGSQGCEGKLTRALQKAFHEEIKKQLLVFEGELQGK